MREFYVQSSDVLGRDLVVVDGEGNKIENILEFTLRAYKNEPMRLELTIIPNGVNVKAVVDEINFTCPVCRETSSHTCEEVGPP